ncbi:MAG: hypothetical protein HYY51_04550 [Candidatus Magasanikbacteria bacterium]|nr:hypothetical protein [Candidatus Magasanikbacteria bacterium]
MKNKNDIFIVLITLALGVSARLLPHPANFAPIGALAIFGGVYLPKRIALLLPLSAMFLSDMIIGFYNPAIMISVYLGFIIMGLIGLIIRKKRRLSRIIGGTMLGSIIFFLITNAAVWLFGTMYAHNLNGLVQSYVMAIPFFKNSLFADLFYICILAGIYETGTYYAKKTSLLSKEIV